MDDSESVTEWMGFVHKNAGYFMPMPQRPQSRSGTGTGATSRGEAWMKPTISSSAVEEELDDMEAGMEAGQFGYTTTDGETSGKGNPLGDFGTWDYETEFCERIGRLQYFYCLKKLPSDMSRGQVFHGFELQFWANSDPHAKEVVLGHRMADISQAKRSVFAAGLEKLPPSIQMAPPVAPKKKAQAPTQRPLGASGLAKAPVVKALAQDQIDGKPMASQSQAVSQSYVRDNQQPFKEPAPAPIASTSKRSSSPLGSRFFYGSRNDHHDSVPVREEKRFEEQAPFMSSPEAEHAEYQRPATQSVSDENFKVLIPRGEGSIILESYRQWGSGRGARGGGGGQYYF